MRSITLNPTAQELVTFDGDLLGESRQFIGTRQNPNLRRGVTVTLYRKAGSTHVAAITFESSRPRERCVTWVVEGETLDDVAVLAALRARDILPEGMGFPPVPEYAGRQENLRQVMTELALSALAFALSQAADTQP